MQFLPGNDGMGDTVSKFMHAGKQGRPGRRTGGADVKIVKAYTFGPQPVGVRRLEVGMPVSVDVSISLIIRENENDVWLLGDRETAGTREPKSDGAEGFDLHGAKQTISWL